MTQAAPTSRAELTMKALITGENPGVQNLLLLDPDGQNASIGATPFNPRSGNFELVGAGSGMDSLVGRLTGQGGVVKRLPMIDPDGQTLSLDDLVDRQGEAEGGLIQPCSLATTARALRDGAEMLFALNPAAGVWGCLLQTYDTFNEAKTVWGNTTPDMGTPTRVGVTAGTVAAGQCGLRQMSDAKAGDSAVDGHKLSAVERVLNGVLGFIQFAGTVAGISGSCWAEAPP